MRYLTMLFLIYSATSSAAQTPTTWSCTYRDKSASSNTLMLKFRSNKNTIRSFEDDDDEIEKSLRDEYTILDNDEIALVAVTNQTRLPGDIFTQLLIINKRTGTFLKISIYFKNGIQTSEKISSMCTPYKIK